MVWQKLNGSLGNINFELKGKKMSIDLYIYCGLALIFMELFLPGFILVPFGISCLLTALLAYFVPSVFIQIAFFVSSSAILFFVLRKIYLKFVNVKSNAVFGLVGQKAKISQIFTDKLSPGKCKLFGDEYEIVSPTLEEEQNILKNLQLGDVVIIENVIGNKVHVRKI
jgi:membrane protein implicated in regulation of membrane protease activity